MSIIQTFIGNAIGHKASTIIGLIIGAISFFLTGATDPSSTGIIPPQIVTDLGYVVSIGSIIFGAAAKNPGVGE